RFTLLFSHSCHTHRRPHLFPYTTLFRSIAEIRVSEINNAAEFGGVSDITTVSKSGSNALHGAVFENLQNTALNARNPFSAAKTRSEEHTSELQSPYDLVCRLLLEKKKKR